MSRPAAANHAAEPAAPPIVLASMSPRRRQLLEQIGLAFEIMAPDLDEAPLPGEDAVTHVRRLALEKARAVAARRPDALVIAGDTVVVLDGEILVKPADPDDAVAMLLRLQGRTHRVETGMAVVAPGGREGSEVVGADVTFRSFDYRTAEAYAATEEPMDKAGAYGIQGYGAVLVEGIVGDFFAVMGMSVVAVVRLMEEVGVAYRFG